MPNATPRQGHLGGLLRTNRLAIAGEIVVVFLPLYVCVTINDRLGSDRVPLGGGLALKGGGLTYLGLALSLALLWIASKLRGAGWSDYGLARPRSWIRTVLMALGVALAVLGAVTLAINPLIQALPGLAPRDMSSFGLLAGNLSNLIINVLAMWFTAAFVEELLWRGYLFDRLVALLGRQTWHAWAIALAGSAVVFGLIHAYQGPAGVLKVGAIGLVLGLCYLAVGRALWPLILAHALIDTLDFVTHYLGG